MTQQNPPAQKEKPDIKYPCLWAYKVIGEDCTLLKEVLIKACKPYTPKIEHSQSSSKGKYHSLQAELTVPSEEVRLAIYQRLQADPAVKIVL
ncbi:MAG: cytoplasmic protein [Desulfobacterales bacterium]|nr:MAG: cytoplasmic protein [Desulfobacterales bacterium]